LCSARLGTAIRGQVTSNMPNRTAVIIGAGPAGLTAALEFLRRSDIKPIVLEASHEIGGISRTILFKGNRMDIGGHRFFSKNDWVMNWWAQLMPTKSNGAIDVKTRYQNQVRALPTPSDNDLANGEDLVMLVRPRKSRIYFLRKFFDYPITLTAGTLRGLGVVRTVKIGTSYIRAHFRQRKPEKSLEDFLINRFGRQLYLTFVKSYTEKVWGIACDRISAEWGAQRIKGLSLTTAITHIIKKAFKVNPKDISQKDTETSLIEKFLYPKSVMSGYKSNRINWLLFP
jgi:protoporphyrinogen oxidase